MEKVLIDLCHGTRTLTTINPHDWALVVAQEGVLGDCCIAGMLLVCVALFFGPD
jgi:hypothetical protein